MDISSEFACPTCSEGTLVVRQTAVPCHDATEAAGAIALWTCKACDLAALSSTAPEMVDAEGRPVGYLIRESAVTAVAAALASGSFLVAAAAFDMWAHPDREFTLARKRR